VTDEEPAALGAGFSGPVEYGGLPSSPPLWFGVTGKEPLKEGHHSSSSLRLFVNGQHPNVHRQAPGTPCQPRGVEAALTTEGNGSRN